MKPRSPNLFFALLCLCLLPLSPDASLRSEEAAVAPPLHRIHFGSCLHQDDPMPILDTIVTDGPELFLFLGDNIYADTEDMDIMRRKYAVLAANASFSLLRLSCPVMAIWDDHDYGLNDAGAEYSQREASQEIFVNFWGDAPGSPRRRRDGVYEARTVGPEEKRVQIILLDTRFFRGPLKVGERRVGGPYYPDPDPSVPMLGEEQWTWLEDRLREPAELRLVVSGIQVVAAAAGQETWSNLPAERQRLIDLIAKTEAAGVIFLSGDRHWSELSMQEEGTPYPLYDLTSSSLNRRHPRGTPTENRWRISESTYHLENYGVVDVDWEEEDPLVTLSIFDIEGETRITHSLRLGALR